MNLPLLSSAHSDNRVLVPMLMWRVFHMTSMTSEIWIHLPTRVLKRDLYSSANQTCEVGLVAPLQIVRRQVIAGDGFLQNVNHAFSLHDQSLAEGADSGSFRTSRGHLGIACQHNRQVVTA